MQRDFKLKFSALLKPYDIKYTENSKINCLNKHCLRITTIVCNIIIVVSVVTAFIINYRHSRKQPFFV